MSLSIHFCGVLLACSTPGHLCTGRRQLWPTEPCGLGTRRRCKRGSRAFAHRPDGESFSYRRALSLSSPFFTTRCIAANKALLEAERVRKVNAEAKNQLESFIINTRDKLSSDDVMEEVGGSPASPSLLYTTLLCTVS